MHYLQDFSLIHEYCILGEDKEIESMLRDGMLSAVDLKFCLTPELLILTCIFQNYDILRVIINALPKNDPYWKVFLKDTYAYALTDGELKSASLIEMKNIFSELTDLV